MTRVIRYRARAVPRPVREAEIKYVYNLYLGGWFEIKQVLLANYTYTKSELSVGPDDGVTVTQGESVITAPALTHFTDGGSLVGQSDHL